MPTVRDILKELGGASVVAAESGIPMTTVHSWARANRVPDWRKASINAVAEKMGKPLPYAPEARAA